MAKFDSKKTYICTYCNKPLTGTVLKKSVSVGKGRQMHQACWNKFKNESMEQVKERQKDRQPDAKCAIYFKDYKKIIVNICKEFDFYKLINDEKFDPEEKITEIVKKVLRENGMMNFEIVVPIEKSDSFDINKIDATINEYAKQRRIKYTLVKRVIYREPEEVESA